MKPFSKVIIILLFFTLLVELASASFPYSFEIDHVSTVSYVVDGDSLEIESGYDIRLADIDAPEENETGYSSARKYLSSLILSRTIYLDIDNITITDPYGNLVCVAYIRENSTHFMNINKALLVEGYADEWNFTNNEFDPDDWTLYFEASELYILDFQALFECNEVRTVYPSNTDSKPLGCGSAKETDWLASAFITTTLNDHSEGLDTEASFVDQSTGKAMGDYGWGVVSFGGPFVNPVVKRSENESTPIEDRAPVKFYDEGGYAKFKHWNGDTISGAMLPWSNVNDDKDMFVIEVFKDGDGRNMLLCYGFGWKGTYASGKYFNDVIYPDLESYPYSWIIVKWEDTNGDGFVNTQEGGDTYTVIASG
jgi:endonuclease YncB( thermonuclease family)